MDEAFGDYGGGRGRYLVMCSVFSHGGNTCLVWFG